MRRYALAFSLAFCFVATGLAQGTYAGTWDTTFGKMTLTQEGDKVSGHYLMGNERCTVEGKVDKNKLTFAYQEPNASGEGWFELAADGKGFAGKWREQGMSEWGEWIGKRLTSVAVAAAPPPGFSGLWDSSFGRMRLVQDGKNVTGIYSYGGGSTITGTVEGNKLIFKYKESAAEGEGSFDLAADGKSFRGKWKAKGASRMTDWTGTRVVPKAGISWLIVVEARWESSIAEEEYAFGNMLRAFFSRAPRVNVRHRFFTDEASLRRWCGEVAYLAEPAVLVIASHGSAKGPEADGKTVPSKVLGESLRYASNLKLLHFSACDIMKGKAGDEILSAVDKPNRFPVSGYANSVDWAASAIIEFAYLELVLVRGLSPSGAADQLGKLMPFSKDRGVSGSAFGHAAFRLLKPDETK